MKHECPQIMDLLVDYLDGELTEEQKEHLEMHLSLCPPCVAFLDGYKATGKVCRNALKQDMPSEMKESLGNFLRKCCGEKKECDSE